MNGTEDCYNVETSFNALTGIRKVATWQHSATDRVLGSSCFNALTGIRKVATLYSDAALSNNSRGFQCLDRHKEGCNVLQNEVISVTKVVSFNALTGIRKVATTIWLIGGFFRLDVSMP